MIPIRPYIRESAQNFLKDCEVLTPHRTRVVKNGPNFFSVRGCTYMVYVIYIHNHNTNKFNNIITLKISKQV